MFSSYHHLPFRPGVGLMILNHDKQVFVGRRVDTRSESWQMPQGGIDGDETPEQAVMRELKEETGIISAHIIGQSKDWFYYDLPEYLIPRLWDGQYRGQKQKWFALKFEGDDKEINIQQDPAEFMDWRWASLHELTSVIVPFKKKLYMAVLDEFKEIIDLKD
jgi:putative (di)nucleoside polyphosphate hydrolase